MSYMTNREPEGLIPWQATDEEDDRKVRSELNRILEHSLFRRSSRYASLLQFIVERTLEGHHQDLKERSIGIAVFHRAHDYDTNSDPVVRFCAAEVRKRLALYYQVNMNVPLEIQVPLGSYVPRFFIRQEVAEHSTPSAGAAEAPAEVELPAVIALPEAAPKRRIPGWALSVLLAIAVALSVVAYRGWQISSSILALWQPLFSTPQEILICTGIPPEGKRPESNTSQLSIEEHFLQSGEKVSFATASAISKLSGFLQANKKTYSLINADKSSVDQLREHPIILVNANNNRWTLFMTKNLRYHFESRDGVGYIVDNKQPTNKDWKIDFNQPYQSEKEDYAIVARFFDSTIQAPVVIVAGIGSIGTLAAAGFVTSPQAVQDLNAVAPKNWRDQGVEVVLRAAVVDGQLGQVQVVAVHVW